LSLSLFPFKERKSSKPKKQKHFYLKKSERSRVGRRRQACDSKCPRADNHDHDFSLVFSFGVVVFLLIFGLSFFTLTATTLKERIKRRREKRKLYY
jgi:hypothetical protein